MNHFQYLFFLERFEKRKRETSPELTRMKQYFRFGEHDITFQYDFTQHVLTMSGRQTERKTVNHHLDLILKSLKDVMKIKNVEINCLIRLFVKDKEEFHSYGPNPGQVRLMLKELSFHYTKKGFVPSDYELSDLYSLVPLTQEGKIQLYYRLMGSEKVLLRTFSTVDEVMDWKADKNYTQHAKSLLTNTVSDPNQKNSSHFLQIHCNITERMEYDAFIYTINTSIKQGTTRLHEESFSFTDTEGIGFIKTLEVKKDLVQKQLDYMKTYFLLFEEFAKKAKEHDDNFLFRGYQQIEFLLFDISYLIKISPQIDKDFISIIIDIFEKESKTKIKEILAKETTIPVAKSIVSKQIETWVKSRKLASLMK